MILSGELGSAAGWAGARPRGSIPIAGAVNRWCAALASCLLILAGLTGFEWTEREAGIAAYNPTAITKGVQRGAASGRHIVPPARETAVGAYSGAPYTYPSDVRFEKPGRSDFTLHDVQWLGKPFKSPIYYGVRVMRWFGSGSTGTMLDFTHSKTISDREQTVKLSGTVDGQPAPAEAKIDTMFRHLEASHGHNMLTLNGLMRLPSLSARVSPYIGIGAGVSLPHSEVQLRTDNSRTYEYQFAGPVTQVLAGLELRLPQFSYFLEYKFSVAPYLMPLSHREGTILFADLWRQAAAWWTGEPPPGGFLTTRLSSHQVIGGIAVRIASPVTAAP